MQSTLKPEKADPHDVFEIAPGVVLAARPEHASATPAPDTTVQAPQAPTAPEVAVTPDVIVTPEPPVEATFRAASVDDVLARGDRTPTERWVGRAV